LENRPLDEVVPGSDAVVLVTAHPGIDHIAIAEQAGLFVDLRGVTRGQRAAANVVRL
jgi:UDP-N-acetyl-D-glucosamine dehydrogenase